MPSHRPESPPSDTPRPHDDWAPIYDLVYEATMGSHLADMTGRTLAEIRSAIGEKGAIVDFGAGTGRLAIPLALAGYDVTAVEPSIGMARELRRKAELKPACIDVVISRMQDFRPRRRYSLALAVFTVLSYILTDEELRTAMSVVARSLEGGGVFIADVASAALFTSPQQYEGAAAKRRIEITPAERPALYQYAESGTVRRDGATCQYSTEPFLIRHWTSTQIDRTANDYGLVLRRDFMIAGASYRVYAAGEVPE